MWVQQSVGVGAQSRWHSEAMHLVIYETCGLHILIVIFQLLHNRLTFQFADVGSCPANFIADDAHETQVVVSLALLATFLIRTLGGVAQSALMIALVIVIRNLLLNRLIDVAIVLRLHCR